MSDALAPTRVRLREDDWVGLDRGVVIIAGEESSSEVVSSGRAWRGRSSEGIVLVSGRRGEADEEGLLLLLVSGSAMIF